MATQQQDGKPRDHTRLNIWLTFAATILAALIAGVFALLTAGGDDDKPAAAPTQQAAPPPAATVDTTTTTATATSTAPAPESSASVLFTGPIVVQAFGLKDVVDLDEQPPRAVDNAGNAGDVNVDLAGAGRTNVSKAAFTSPSFATWTGTGTPQFTQCRNAALSQGTDGVKSAKVGAVLCVQTTEKKHRPPHDQEDRLAPGRGHL